MRWVTQHRKYRDRAGHALRQIVGLVRYDDTWRQRNDLGWGWFERARKLRFAHGHGIGANSLIGMGATVLNGAQIGENCLIGAGALIPEGKVIPDGSLVVGVPGKVVRSLDDAAIEGLKQSALNYQMNAERFMKDLQAI